MTARYNLARLAEEAFERLGDHDALVFEGATHRASSLSDRGAALGAGLVELGLEPGDRVVVMMTNSPEVQIAYNALWRAGCVITPAIFLLPPDELRHVVADSEAKAIITSPELLDSVKAGCEGIETLKWIISSGEESDGVISLSSLESGSSGTIVPARRRRSCCADVHGRHHGPCERGHALSREPLSRGQERGSRVRTLQAFRGRSCRCRLRIRSD